MTSCLEPLLGDGASTKVVVTMEADIQLENFCAGLVGVKECQPFVLYLLTSIRARE
jgi:hypothetical protein